MFNWMYTQLKKCCKLFLYKYIYIQTLGFMNDFFYFYIALLIFIIKKTAELSRLHNVTSKA